MLQNLGLVKQLAKAYRPGAYLVRIESTVELTGVATGDSCRHIFSDSGATLEDYWTVNLDGRIRYSQNPHILRYDTSADIAPSLLVDSPEAISKALVYGFSRCTERFPGERWSLQVTYDAQGGVPMVSMHLQDTRFANFGQVMISPQTGTLLFRDIFEKCG